MRGSNTKYFSTNFKIVFVYIIYILLSSSFSYKTNLLGEFINDLKQNKNNFTNNNSNSKLSELVSFEAFSLKLLGEGEMANCCLTYEEYVNLVTDLEKEYPNIISTFSIGTTYTNNTIIGVKFNPPKYRANKAILFTGMHHGREPVSMMMNLYILLKLIYIYPDESQELLDSVNIYFIPVINVDGYIKNNQLFKSGSKNYMVRKNRRDSSDEFTCLEDYDYKTVGVDLNRNYGFKFAYDDNGSSNYACQEDYRGKFPFSEAETFSVKNFIENHPEIKIALNYHSYGNLLIRPFNYADSKDSSMNLFMNYTLQKTIYDEFGQEGHFPAGNLEGNGMETILYKANGEASDWMLGEKRIVAFSPELGVSDGNSNSFYPPRHVLFQILEKNINSAMYAITRAAFYLQFKVVQKMYLSCEIVKQFEHKFLEKDEEEKKEEKVCSDGVNQYSSQIQIHNNGFSDFKGQIEFELTINVENFKYLTVNLNTGHRAIYESNKNITNSSNYENQTNIGIIGNPTTITLFDKDYSNDQNNKIEKIKFNIDFIESFNQQILHIKFYLNKEINLGNTNKTFVSLQRVNKNTSDVLEQLNLKFNNPKYSLQFSEFEKFEMKKGQDNSPNDSKLNKNKFWTIIEEYYKIIVLTVLIGLVILLIVIMIKFYLSRRSVCTTDQVPNERNELSYLELDNIGRDI